MNSIVAAPLSCLASNSSPAREIWRGLVTLPVACPKALMATPDSREAVTGRGDRVDPAPTSARPE